MTPVPGPIRVLQVLHTLARAGAEQLVYELSAANREQLQTAAVCLDQLGPLAQALQDQGSEVFFTRRKAGMDFSQIGRLAEIIRTFRPDVIHAHQYTPFFYAALAAARARAGKVLFTEHGRHFPDVVSGKRRAFNWFLSRRAKRITAVCEFTRRRLIEREGMPAHRIEVIYNGVDPSRFDGLPDRLEARRRLSLEAARWVILQVGTFRPVKDQATAIRAMRHVHQELPGAVLAFAGDGPDLPACHELAATCGLQGAVKFLGSRADIPQVLAAADVLLLTSLSEAHSVSLLEGMAAGVPVVATDVGGNPETVVAGQTGLIAPAGDDVAIAQCLMKLLRDEALRQAMGQAARQRVRERFLRSDMHRRYLDIYQEIARRGDA
jgi:glycosyltransferase involved in cell wall biosynthesis